MPRATTEKVSPGAPFRMPAGLFNDLVDMRDAHVRQELNRPGAAPAIAAGGLQIKVRNDTGAALVAGSALRVADRLTTNVRRDHLHFSGTTITDVDEPYCVILRDMPDGATGDAVIGGVALVNCNVWSTSHTHVTLSGSSVQWTSTDFGSCPILHALSSTGVQDLLVQLGPATKKPVIEFKLTQALSTTDAIETGTILRQYGWGMDAATTPSGIFLHNKSTGGGNYQFSGAVNHEGYAVWWEGVKYIIIQMWCP